MKKAARAVTFHQHGEPAEVLRVETHELPQPGPHEALVEMRAAPVNPADINLIQGTYGKLPPLPAVAGLEGVGVVTVLGAAAHGVQLGERVLLPHGLGSWREAAVVNAATLIPVPREIPVEQAAMLKINPPTAWRMLHDFAELRRGDWVAQNAANSGVGRAVIAIAKSLGVRTVNIVRRAELLEELGRAGADVTLLDGENLPREIAEATNHAPIPLALNAVGGESAVRLAKALAPGGTVVTYGAMGRQPLRIPNGLLIFKNIALRGFWVSRWYAHAADEQVRAMFAQLFPLAASGALASPVERMFSIDEAPAAVARAMESGRGGKILLRLGEQGEAAAASFSPAA